MTTILIADDASLARLHTKEILAEAGYEVIEAENGRQACDAYSRKRPEGVLMDIAMPEMDGIEALSFILRHDPGARVAMVSGQGHHPTVLKALRLGARDFIVKPYNAERLLAAVTKLLS